jgi:UDP-N-acetylmuramate dehydrogenase
MSQTAAIADALSGKFAGKVRTDHPLARLTTYRVGGHAALYVEPADKRDLEILGSALRAGGASVPPLVIGRGSNLVISDRGWPGVAIRLPGARWSWIQGAEDPSGLRAGASTSLPLLANWSARRGLAGAEFLVAVPGSVGGAIKMNAGAHGREVKDCLLSATVFDLELLETSERPAIALGYSYRGSNIADDILVLEARFALTPSDPAEVRSRMESYRRHRAETQPGAVQNAGSVFKNPPGDHAGRLVEAVGLKGLSVGGAAVSNLHANFFIADDNATAQDVYDLVHIVRARVLQEHGVKLEPEIRFVGEFEATTEGVAR